MLYPASSRYTIMCFKGCLLLCMPVILKLKMAATLWQRLTFLGFDRVFKCF